MELIKADISDLYSLQNLSIRTFTETFADDNSSKDMALYLQESFASVKLFRELSYPLTDFYFVRLESQLIAYLKLNFGAAQSEPMGNEAMELERIYILKDFQGKGSGQLLMDKAIEIARSKKVKFIWLGVWEQNHRALAFYKKNGFEIYGQHIFQFGSDPQTDVLMRLFL